MKQEGGLLYEKIFENIANPELFTEQYLNW